MLKPAFNRLFSRETKKKSLCLSVALLLCIPTFAYLVMNFYGPTSAYAASAPAYTINGVAFHDANRNGMYDAGESGVADVDVNAYDQAGKNVASARTDRSGSYKLNIPAETGSVRVQSRDSRSNIVVDGKQPASIANLAVTQLNSRHCEEEEYNYCEDKPEDKPGHEKTPEPGDKPEHEKTPEPGDEPEHEKTPEPGDKPEHEKTPEPGDKPEHEKTPEPGDKPEHEKPGHDKPEHDKPGEDKPGHEDVPEAPKVPKMPPTGSRPA